MIECKLSYVFAFMIHDYNKLLLGQPSPIAQEKIQEDEHAKKYAWELKIVISWVRFLSSAQPNISTEDHEKDKNKIYCVKGVNLR